MNKQTWETISESPVYGSLKKRWVDACLSGEQNQVITYLLTIWETQYRNRTTELPAQIVSMVLDEVHYLFDINGERLIAACCLSKGKNRHKRETSRMKGHPLSDGREYHRGHAIPHSMGGGTGINLVPQLASVNIGPFRVLENKAVKTPGTLYFTYWEYELDSQTPIAVHQGAICPMETPDIRRFLN